MGRHSAPDDADADTEDLRAYAPYDATNEDTEWDPHAPNPWVAGALTGACLTLVVVILLVLTVGRLVK